jgi:hypothetical protein
VNGEVVLGADGLAAEGAGESLPLVESLVVRQGFRLEAGLAIKTHPKKPPKKTHLNWFLWVF